MATKVLYFGSGSQLYTFPETQRDFSDNFSDLVPATQRMPGLSGGFDEFGDSSAPQEIGRITVGFTLVSSTREGMTTKRDAVKAMTGFGVQSLWMQPSDPALAPRWCRAKVNSIQIPQRLDEHTDLHQPVTVIFQAPDPHWYSGGTELATWGGGSVWGGSATWGGGTTSTACSGTQTDFTISPGGNVATKPRIVISCAAGQTITNPRLQRIVGGTVVDEVAWLGTLLAGDLLEIDNRAMKVTKNGADAYSSAFSFLRADWFLLLPGTNALRLLAANSGDACSVLMRYYDTWV